MCHIALYFVVLVFSLWYSKVSCYRRRETAFPTSLNIVPQGDHFYNQSIVMYSYHKQDYKLYTCGNRISKMTAQNRISNFLS